MRMMKPMKKMGIKTRMRTNEIVTMMKMKRMMKTMTIRTTMRMMGKMKMMTMKKEKKPDEHDEIDENFIAMKLMGT